MTSKITYTFTDEAPALATTFLYPMIHQILGEFGITTELKSISLADRVRSLFDHTQNHDLADLECLVRSEHAQIIKLPNISASLFQLKECIDELQRAGVPLPNYPDRALTDKDREIQKTYHQALGSAVNPKLRIGNSIRYIPPAVKIFAQNNPHPMGLWSRDSKSSVRSMTQQSFAHTQKAIEASQAETIKIVFVPNKGTVEVMTDSIELEKGDVVDGSTLSCAALKQFITQAKQQAEQDGVLFSLHLKATMMKVSDPVIFGYTIEAYLSDWFDKYSTELKAMHIDAKQGLESVIKKITQYSQHPPNPSHLKSFDTQKMIHELKEHLNGTPGLAMVHSDRGITNFHVPSDMIIDASMAAMIRDGGKLWNKEGELQDALAVIPDPLYADLYDQTIQFCKTHGAFDPTTMGSVSNIGLMAHKAQEYGSHPTTFVAQQAGEFQVIDSQDSVLFRHTVHKGDIWRLCITRHTAITNWIETALNHAQDHPDEALIFWLDDQQPHDSLLIHKIHEHCNKHRKTTDFEILPLAQACHTTLTRLAKSQNTLSATGNVLRDYITDLFPILELGTSAKMLSVIGLLGGGRIYETGSGGTAPKHVDQLLRENHLRWDCLGEFLALEQAVYTIAQKHEDSAQMALAHTIKTATESYLTHKWQPSRICHQRDTRGSIILWLCECIKNLHHQQLNASGDSRWSYLSDQLLSHQQQILQELIDVQGIAKSHEDIGGYYQLTSKHSSSVMNPSPTFQRIWNHHWPSS